MSDTQLFFQHHVFCCTNTRPEGHHRGSCASKGAEKIRAYMKARTKELGVPDARINSAGCLDRCELGPVVVIYPDGIWYRVQSNEDADDIISEHLLNGRIVERLRLENSDR